MKAKKIMLAVAMVATTMLAPAGAQESEKQFVFRYKSGVIHQTAPSIPAPFASWLRVQTSSGWAFECQVDDPTAAASLAASIQATAGRNLGFSPAHGHQFWGMGWPAISVPGDIGFPVMIFHVSEPGSLEMQASGFGCVNPDGETFEGHWPGATAKGAFDAGMIGTPFTATATLFQAAPAI